MGAVNPVRHYRHPGTDTLACGADRQAADDAYVAWRAEASYRRGYSPYTTWPEGVTCPECRKVVEPVAGGVCRCDICMRDGLVPLPGQTDLLDMLGGGS